MNEKKDYIIDEWYIVDAKFNADAVKYNLIASGVLR